MYLIAALLSYGFERTRIDRTDVKRQRFFIADERKAVIVFSNNEVSFRELNLDEIESKFMSKQLAFPPTYTDVLKSVKYSIHSYKND